MFLDQINKIKMSSTDEVELPDISIGDDVANAAKVILFNDEWHTFEEVIGQILKAVNCTADQAETMTWEVHSKGKSCVFDGAMTECIKVSSVLEEISLHTQIEF